MSKLISYIYISILSLAVAGCSDSDSLDANNTPNSDPALTRHYPVTRTHRLPTEPMRSTHLLDY